jgi:hypothetical protein
MESGRISGKEIASSARRGLASRIIRENPYPCCDPSYVVEHFQGY